MFEQQKRVAIAHCVILGFALLLNFAILFLLLLFLCYGHAIDFAFLSGFSCCLLIGFDTSDARIKRQRVVDEFAEARIILLFATRTFCLVLLLNVTLVITTS